MNLYKSITMEGFALILGSSFGRLMQVLVHRRRTHGTHSEAIAHDRLHYYRCFSCLEIFTSKLFLPHEYEYLGVRRCMTKAQCPCSGAIEWLGQVSFDRKKLERLVSKPVCDGRCTNAVGPTCFCKCNCRNHGTGWTVEVVIDAGIPRPQFSLSTQYDAIARGRDYRALTAAVAALLNSGMKSRVKRLAIREYERARYLTNFKNRIDRLQGIYRQFRGEDFQLPSQTNPLVPPRIKAIEEALNDWFSAKPQRKTAAL